MEMSYEFQPIQECLDAIATCERPGYSCNLDQHDIQKIEQLYREIQMDEYALTRLKKKRRRRSM